MWGIGILTGVGAVAVRGEEKHRRHPAVALSYGAGLVVIVDEFALLLDLQDVYWAKQGRISVDVGVSGIALAGSYFAALPVLRRLRREQQHRRAPESVPVAATPPAPEPSSRLTGTPPRSCDEGGAATPHRPQHIQPVPRDCGLASAPRAGSQPAAQMRLLHRS